MTTLMTALSRRTTGFSPYSIALHRLMLLLLAAVYGRLCLYRTA